MKCGSWDTVTSSCTASRFSFAKSCFPGLWIDSGSPSRAIKGRVEPFFWLCLVGRSGWAWLSPSSEEGSKSQHLSPGPELCQILPAPCEHQICAGLWELILPLGGHWDLFSSQTHLWRSLEFVQVFGSQPSPLEVPGLCVCQPNLPFGGHWDFFFQRSQSSVFSSQTFPSVQPQSSNAGTRPSQAAMVEKMLIKL